MLRVGDSGMWWCVKGYKIKEKNSFWSIFAGKKKEETEAQKKEESAPAEAETKTEDKASADPADTAKSDASEE